MPSRSDSIRTRHLSGIAHGTETLTVRRAGIVRDFPGVTAELFITADEAAAAGYVTLPQIAHAAGVTPATVRGWMDGIYVGRTARFPAPAATRNRAPLAPERLWRRTEVTNYLATRSGDQP